MSKDQKEICLYCKAWCIFIDPGHEGMTMGHGECRLHGPTMNNSVQRWPTTVGDDWCLDFVERRDDHDRRKLLETDYMQGEPYKPTVIGRIKPGDAA
jgi:hypothetical protein